MRRLIATVMCAAWILVLASCASDKKEKSDTGLRFGERIVKQTNDRYSIKSHFQNDVYHASKTVKTSGFKTEEFHGKKKGFFASKDKFKVGTFSQADKSSSSADKTFSGADDKSRLAESTYKTSQSGYADKMSRSDGQASSFANDKYVPHENAAAMQRTSNVKRPLILKDEAGYSEEQVKKLLNKS